ncbi:MAG: Wzz/FepE/Etk N-terminal domain-containing protein [Clostridiales bacterium]
MKDYLKSVFKHLRILIIMIIIFLTLGLLLSNYKIKSKYNATSTLFIYILNDEKTQNNLKEMKLVNNPDSTYQSLKSSEMLVSDFQQMIKTSSILDSAKKELKSKYGNLNSSKIYKNITINVQSGTRIIELSYKDENKKLAVALSNTISEVFKEKSEEILGIDTVNIIGKANNNVVTTGPGKVMLTLGFVLFGTISGLALIYLIEFYKLGYRPISTKYIKK